MTTLTLDIIEDAICFIPSAQRETWIQVGMALKNEFGEDAFQIWDNWSSKDEAYNLKDAAAVWKSFKSGRSITIGTFVHLAKEHGYSFPKENLTDQEKHQRRAEAERRNIELEVKKRQQADLDKANADKAALRAKKMWLKLPPEGEAPYLVAKSVKGYGLRYSPKGSAVAMVQDADKKIHGIQFLKPDGQKRFWPKHMRVTGHFHLIDAPDASKRQRVGVCEGYATGASVHESSGIAVYVAFNTGNLESVGLLVRAAYPDADIIFFADDDHQTKGNPGVSRAKKAAKSAKGRYVAPRFLFREDKDDWTDFNDLQDVEGLDAVRDQVMSFIYSSAAKRKPGTGNSGPPPVDYPPDEEWKYGMGRTQSGSFRADINNTRLVLTHDPRWQGVLRYNEFNYDVLKIKPPPFDNKAETGGWSEVDIERLRCWMAEHYHFTPKPSDALGAVLVVAENNSYHPVREYLEGLVWDKKLRLDNLFHNFMGAEDNEYNRKVSSKFCIGAVARIYAGPGHPVKMDNVLILEGLQGEGKSTVLETLATTSEWFSDTAFDLGHKDGYQNLKGIWIYELAELDSFNKAESTRAKAFFSSKEDYYRPSYGKKAMKFPRQTVFAGSTNATHYLKDPTGNRRYWPVRCSQLNIQELREARDQIWAEAYHRYKQKEPWHVLPHERELFGQEQEERFNADSWEDDAAEWLSSPEQRRENLFTVSEILQGAFGMSKDKHKPPEQMRVGQVMRRLGWSKVRRTPNDIQLWMYLRPEDQRLRLTEESLPL